MAVNILTEVCWVMTPCSLEGSSQNFRRTCCIHIQCWSPLPSRWSWLKTLLWYSEWGVGNDVERNSRGLIWSTDLSFAWRRLRKTVKSLRIGDGLVEIQIWYNDKFIFIERFYISELFFEGLLGRTNFALWLYLCFNSIDPYWLPKPSDIERYICIH
jgi:hypothetical protein